MFIHACLGKNEKGHMTIGGVDTVSLAEQYGTPLYAMDEATIRENCRIYKEALRDAYGEDSLPLYASKAFSCKQIYRIAAEEGIGIDLVSPGEMYTALKAGFPMEKAFFHGNNKTDADLRMSIESGVGYIVVDNTDELTALERIASEMGKVQKILLRITPGIDPHTHQKIITGNVDSKFGNAIVTGQAMAIVKAALACENLTLEGLHCHIGSQIFDCDPFDDAASIMIGFIADIKKETGKEMHFLNLGGGFGVRYVEEHEPIDYAKNIRAIASHIKALCEEKGVHLPAVLMEPGRSIVAASGITLYTVGSVKEIVGFKKYVSIDGGMPDNPRYALYQSPYSVYTANRLNEKAEYTCTIAGRCCESGDLIAEDVTIAKPVRGDLLAVTTTGAYNYSMASNYNRIPRPPVVMIQDGDSYVAVARESYEDLIRNDR
ncbi:MAG: diaminopimelate decarboxylase [Ruminococcaceae bacterium]|nr:diaminopimelate decarboxylase [Oscillospiraceae bacterium]